MIPEANHRPNLQAVGRSSLQSVEPTAYGHPVAQYPSKSTTRHTTKRGSILKPPTSSQPNNETVSAINRSMRLLSAQHARLQPPCVEKIAPSHTQAFGKLSMQ